MPPKRTKGVTFKLVHQSYEDESSNAVMVDEREVRRHLPAAAAPRRRRLRDDDDDDDDMGDNGSASVSDWAHEWASTTSTTAASSSARAGGVRLPGEDEYTSKRNLLRAQDPDDDEINGGGDDDDDDDKLFDDQEEVEFTDDFLREVVFGDGDEEDNEACDDDDDDAAHMSGGAHCDDHLYPQHDITKRGMDRQFTQMMREFNVDARLNDAYTDDPRAHGPLGVNHYFRALEEFVVDKAGVDYTTAEPLRNKGLIQQLKHMALLAGTEMSPKGEVYTTTVLPEKQARFVAEFQRETEEIQQAARQRMSEQRRDEHGGEHEVDEGRQEQEEEEVEEEEEAYVVRDVGNKSNRLDCETAVSTYSTYFNQPNVIRAPETGKRRRGRGAAAMPSSSSSASAQRQQQQQQQEEEEKDMEGAPQLDTQLLFFARHKGETKEEKKMRQQLAKQAQRERRSKKRELKQVYSTLEADEARRAKESQTAKKTVHFF